MDQLPSTQSDSGLSIPFFLPHSSQQQTLRLLELPDDLLDIITSEHNNKNKDDDNNTKPRRTIQLKSASPELTRTDTLSAASSHDAKEGQLHLCTEDKAWAVRQVSTSNSVYVARWDDASVSDRIQSVSTGQDVNMTDGDTHGHGIEASLRLRALAQPNTVLELLPVTQSVEDVMKMLMGLVPLYDTSSKEDPRDQLILQEQYTNARLSDEIPAPNSLIRDAIDRLCCIDIPILPGSRSYNTPSGSACFIPTAGTILDFWRKILDTCAIHSVRLNGAVDLPQLVACISDDCEEVESEGTTDTTTIPLIAIAQKLLYRTLPSLHIGTLALLTTTEARNHTPQSSCLRLSLNPQSIASYLGQLLVLAKLQSQHNVIHQDEFAATFQPSASTTTTPTSLATFLSTWRSLLPLDSHLGDSQNAWLPFITLSNLGPDITYTVSGDSKGTTNDHHGNDLDVRDETGTTTDPTMITFSVAQDVLAFPTPQSTASIPTTGQASTLQASELSASGPVAAVTPGPNAPATTGPPSAATSFAAKPAAGGGKNRKWHEKFAAQRRNV